MNGPPQNIQAEESVIGAMMLSERAVETCAELLSPDDFYFAKHGTMFRAAVELSGQGEPVDIITLANKLESWGKLEDVGGKTKLSELAAIVPAASNAAHHAQIVRETAVLRRLVGAGLNIARLGQERPGELDELLARAEEELTRATAVNSTTVAPINDDLDNIVSAIREAYLTQTPRMGHVTGYPALDHVLSGFWAGQLILLAARPGHGKSTFALNIAENFADRGDAVLFVSLEMSRWELAIRSLARAAEIDSRLLRTGRIEARHAEKMPHGIQIVRGRSSLHVEDDGGMTVQRLGATAARLKRQHDLKLIVVDYLQLMAPPKAENRNVEIGVISRGLKQLARKLDIPILALSQMNRDIERRQDKRPTLADLRDSGSLEQDSDVVIFLHDESAYDHDREPDGMVDVIVAKNRSGQADTVRLGYNKRWSVFRNVTTGPRPLSPQEAAA